jgi:hypothetical protein
MKSGFPGKDEFRRHPVILCRRNINTAAISVLLFRRDLIAAIISNLFFLGENVRHAATIAVQQKL